jgi:hypothetical protein
MNKWEQRVGMIGPLGQRVIGPNQRTAQLDELPENESTMAPAEGVRVVYTLAVTMPESLGSTDGVDSLKLVYRLINEGKDRSDSIDEYPVGQGTEYPEPNQSGWGNNTPVKAKLG